MGMIERAYDTQCTQESRYKKIVYTMKILLLCRGLGAEQRRRGAKRRREERGTITGAG